MRASPLLRVASALASCTMAPPPPDYVQAQRRRGRIVQQCPVAPHPHALRLGAFASPSGRLARRPEGRIGPCVSIRYGSTRTTGHR